MYLVRTLLDQEPQNPTQAGKAEGDLLAWITEVSGGNA